MAFDLNRTITILEQTPATLKAWLGNMPEQLLHASEGEGTWSPFDILGHLNHGERTDWVPRTKIILFADDKHFVPFDRFAQEKESAGKSMHELLDEFAELRANNLKKLRSFDLQPADFEKTGIHPHFGEVKLSWHLSTWSTHDLGHIYQISRVMAKQMKEDCGPWVEYLRVLQE
ncbi:MAG: DinB family protein [Cytophagales bacterium]|nr:DinB family protein [Cytophagales bacterium]